MKAIIFDGKHTYVSPIFAFKKQGWSKDAVAFDSDYTSVKRIAMWYPFRKVFIVEWTEFTHKKGDWQGLDWVIRGKKLLHALRFQENVSLKDFPNFEKFTHETIVPEWFEIKNDQDITSFMSASLGFHDAAPLQAEETGNDLQIRFDTNWGCYITVHFVDIIEADIIDRVGQILNSEIRFEQDAIRWDVTDGFAGWIDGVNYDAPFGNPYVKCKKVFWKIEIECKE